MTRPDLDLLARGRARFTGDLELPVGCLHALPATSPHAHARFTGVDGSAALGQAGVVAVLGARDIPGTNDCGAVSSQPLLADGEVSYLGEPFALVVAETAEAARQAALLVGADWEPLEAVLHASPASARLLLHGPPRTFTQGDVDRAWAECDTIVEGEVSLGSAEHVAFETQCALVVPTETGLLVHSATQAPSAVQTVVARVMGLRMHDVEVDVPRLGGGFGSKEEQANQWAALAALAACHTGRPVRVCLDRTEDARLTGKRHPYDASFRLGLDASGRFIAYEARLRQTAGAVPDLSPAILERSLFHATNAYAIGNVRVTAESRRTNLPPNTAFRGFGAPQAIFVVEAAIRKAAHALGIRPEELQARNLLANGDKLPYGQVVSGARGRQTWAALVARRSPADVRAEIDAHNATDPRVRRGMAIVPVCFGIAFTARVLNQAEALVHVYVDGSVGVSTGAVEMGQGVAGKIRTVVARTLGIDEALVHVESTNTTRTANVSPTAASTGTDLNGAAAREACLEILSNLPDGPGDWLDRVHVAHDRRRSLSALAHVVMPGLTPGTPFRYHVFGAALVEAEVDVLLGIGRIVRVTVAHDCGESLDELTDLGQIEGAVVQGIGWMTTEEVVRDASGRLLTDSLATYKIPDVADAPELDVQLLQSPSPVGLLGSKAVGEPPLVYGLGAFFALQDAIATFNPAAGSEFTTPLTSERIFSLLHGVEDA